MTAQAYQPSDYRSYLLRLWRANRNGEPLWRASLEDAVSGERRGFATVEALTAFLLQSVGEEGENRGSAEGADQSARIKGRGSEGADQSARIRWHVPQSASSADPRFQSASSAYPRF